MRPVLRRLTAAILVILLLLSGCAGQPAFRGNALDTPIPAPDFTLTDQYGDSFSLSDQRGQVVLLFFGYASCPDVCPTTLGVWRGIQQDLGDDAARVSFVFVTVDPERDTQERMREHLGLFSPDFIGLWGTLEELEPVYQAYGVFREEESMPDSELDYQVIHTSSTYVIDTEGYWRLRHLFGTPTEDVLYDIKLLLEEGN